MPGALIAEDEPLLAAALGEELARAWPELRLLATVGDGDSAVAQALALRPDVLFLDIRMPGRDGLDAALALAEAWPSGQRFPLLVFVTAYDQYALQAFDAQATDYLLKPLQPERLRRTVARLQQQLATRPAADDAAPAPLAATATAAGGADPALEQALAQLRRLLAPAAAAAPVPRLQVVQASVGSAIHLVPVDEVLLFEAADKYVRVLTAQREYLIRTPLRELLPQLDASEFWQVHRGTVVRARAVARVERDAAGRCTLALHGRSERVAVSRVYAHLFKAM